MEIKTNLSDNEIEFRNKRRLAFQSKKFNNEKFDVDNILQNAEFYMKSFEDDVAESSDFISDTSSGYSSQHLDSSVDVEFDVISTDSESGSDEKNYRVLSVHRIFKSFRKSNYKFDKEKVTQIDGLNKQLTKKDYIVQELINTEQKYVDCLEKIIKEYVEYITQKKLQYSLSEDFNSMAIWLVTISKESKKFIDDLKLCHKNYDKIGEVFLKHNKLFNRYPEYCQHKSLVTEKLTKSVQNVIKPKEDQLKDKLGLFSGLLHPVQRIGRYELLLKSLLEQLIKEFVPAQQVLEARYFIQNIAITSNTFIALGSIRDKKFDIKHTGQYRKNFYFTMTSETTTKFVSVPISLLLFEKVLIIAEERKASGFTYFVYKDHLEMKYFNYNFKKKSSKLKLKLSFTAKEGKRIYHLRVDDPRIKEDFFKEIKTIMYKNRPFSAEDVVIKKKPARRINDAETLAI